MGATKWTIQDSNQFDITDDRGDTTQLVYDRVECALVIGDDSDQVDLSRNGLALLQIMNCLDSLVVASVNVEIDPAVQHMAGKHGKVLRLGVEKQLQYDLTTQTSVLKAFTPCHV